MEQGFVRPSRSSIAGNAQLVLVMVAVSASFAGNSVIVKVALAPPNDVDPVVFSFLRDVGGALVLLCVCRFQGNLVWPRREDVGVFVLLGVLGVYIGQQFMVVALQYDAVTPLNAMLLQPSQPVLTVLIAALFGTEALELSTTHWRLKLAGILVGACGAMYSVYMASTRDTPPSPPSPPTTHPHEKHQGGALVGNMLLIVQCVSGKVGDTRTRASAASHHVSHHASHHVSHHAAYHVSHHASHHVSHHASHHPPCDRRPLTTPMRTLPETAPSTSCCRSTRSR